MHISQERRNTVVLANAVELATESIMRVLGNNTATEVEGVKQTRQIVADAVASRIHSRIKMAVGA
jgi:hypothetical protein